MARKETVTKVIDGDTFVTDRRKHPVILADVDVPEKGEKGYGAAKKALKDMIQGKEVAIETVGRGKKNVGSVARVKFGRSSVNKAMAKHSK